MCEGASEEKVTTRILRAQEAVASARNGRVFILEEEFGGDVEAAAEAANVVFVEFALAAENLGDDAGSAEDASEVLLQEAVVVHERLEDFERLGVRERVVAGLQGFRRER